MFSENLNPFSTAVLATFNKAVIFHPIQLQTEETAYLGKGIQRYPYVFALYPFFQILSKFFLL